MSVSATSLVSKSVMTAPMTNAPTTARMPIVVYWRRMKATAPSKIVPGDVLHLLRPGVARQDVPGEVDREEHGDDARRQDDQLERVGIHQGLRVLHI